MNGRIYRISAILLLLLLGAATISAMAMPPGEVPTHSWWSWILPRAGSLYTPTPTKTPLLRTGAATAVATAMPITTPTLTATPMPTKKPKTGTNWLALADGYGLDRSGRWILVDQNRQVMVVGEGDSILKIFPVSTGDPQKDGTPAWLGTVGKYWGTFESADGSYADNAWYLFRHNGAILIHSDPYFMMNGRREYIELDALGHRPASHGCIRMAPRDAEWLTMWNPKGVPILITPCNCGK